MTNAMISSEEAQSYQSKGLSPRRRTYEVGMRGLLYLSPRASPACCSSFSSATSSTGACPI